MNVVRAVDATSGELLWEYDPQVSLNADRMRAGWDHNRGIGFWKGKVYVATWDGRLNAIDAATGEEIWSTLTIDPGAALYITGAPKIFKGKVLVGNGGTENGPTRGYVTAYDAETGEQAWRFYIVPGNPADGFESEAMEMAAETWTGDWWRHGGGDNLFLCSIVALDPDTGEYLWHYQTTPGESWDYNSNMDIVLADLDIEGRERKVILHAPKNGFFYVIDRTDGELISAEPFTNTTWASRIDMETGRPVEVPGARYETGEAHVAPGPLGGHNWHAMSFNPETGLAYYPAMHLEHVYSDEGIDLAGFQSVSYEGGLGVNQVFSGPSRSGPLATLQAWDPVRQELAWEVPLEGMFNPGTMTTAGNLVFEGRLDGTFRAYRADTGEELWSVDLGLGISAPPITYSVDGKQYVALLVGWQGAMAGMAPDLRASYMVASAELFAGVVRDGNRAVGGMPRFADLTDDELTALQHYIRQQADVALAGAQR